MKIKPILDRILIKEIEEKRKSSILIPDNIDKPKQGIGKVLSVGKGKITEEGRETIDVKVGDTIIFKRSLPLVITDENYKNGEEFLMIYFEDVLVKVNAGSKGRNKSKVKL